MGPRLSDIDIAVLAGGLGTRLAGAVPGLPKVLAPVAGRPFVEHLIDWLAPQGAKRIVFLLGHRAEMVTAHLAAHPRAGIEFDWSVESEPLGTGGALAFASPKFRGDPVLVINGDTFVDADLGAFCAAYAPPATMLAVAVDDAGRYGRLDIAQGRVQRFVEKDPAFKGKAAINAGLYLLSRETIACIAKGKGVSLERDVFERMAPGTIAAHVDAKARFVDIGTPESWQGAASIVAGQRE
jgi:NDP-sugar pyrophosphorylase family protein